MCVRERQKKRPARAPRNARTDLEPIGVSNRNRGGFVADSARLWESKMAEGFAANSVPVKRWSRELFLPTAVWASLVFSAIVLLQNDLHGQQPSATPDVRQEEVDYLKSIGTVVSAVAGPGFAVWYAWYMTTKRLPEIEDGHKETMAQLRSDHKAEIAGLINDFRSDIKVLWDTKRSDDALWRESIRQVGGGK